MVFATAAGLVACGPSAPKANLTNELDSLSYTMGITNSQGLLDYATSRLGIDSASTADFINGIQEGSSDVNDKQKANLAGMQIGQQLSGDMYESINKQLFRGDSVNSLNKAQFITGFMQGIEGKSSVKVEEASTYVRTKAEAIQKDTVKTAMDANVLDSLSFMMGLSNTQGLMDYATGRLGVDSAHVSEFIKGIQEGTKVSDSKQKAHLAGMQIGQQISGEIFSSINNQMFGEDQKGLSKENFLAGFLEGTRGTNTISMDDALAYVNTKAQAIKDKALEKKYAEYKKQNEDFLTNNKNKEGIKTTESGLQYRIVTEGKGEVPTKESRVKVHYKGTLIDGTQFDSSYDRKEPTTFKANQVISGWTEALTMMPVGSKWELYIPQELAYGSRDMGEIKPFSTLIFEVELLSIEK